MSKHTVVQTYTAIARIMQSLDSGEMSAAYAHNLFQSLVEQADPSLKLTLPTIAELEERFSQDTFSYEQSYESSQVC